jgi:hypothetical protein
MCGREHLRKRKYANIKGEISEINRSLNGTSFKIVLALNDTDKHLSHIKIFKNNVEKQPIIYYNPNIKAID